MKKLVLVGSYTKSYLIFRYDLLKELIRNNYEVYCLINDYDKLTIKKLQDIGVHTRQVSLKRNQIGLLSDLSYLWRLHKLMTEIKPSIVLSYTIKPNIYSNIVSFFSKKEFKSFCLITGLGFFANRPNTIKEKILFWLYSLKNNTDLKVVI